MEQLKEKINMQNIIIAFIILQPIIDIITGITIQYTNISITFGILIRTVFMVFCVIVGFIKANKKYRIAMGVYFGILAIYMFGFLVNAYIENGTNLIFTQIKGLVKNFYLPIIIVALIPIFKEYNIQISNKTLNITLLIYTITIFICNILGIAFLTYKAGDKAGTVGLFYSANEIGAILCLLSPFLVVDFIRRKVTAWDIVSLALLVYAVLQLGTKVPYFGLIILILAIIFACIIEIKVNKKNLYKKAGAFFSFLIAIYLVTGLTPVGENLTKIYGDVFLITKEDLKFGNQEQKPHEITSFKNLEELKTVSVSGRNDFLKANKEKYKNGNFIDKTIGIGFVENEEGNYKELKQTEMDYFDILFCNGIVGAILFAIPIITFLVILIRSTIQKRKKIELEEIYFIVMAGVVALLAGHVLNAPAVSIYIAIILLRYDSKLRNLENKEEV